MGRYLRLYAYFLRFSFSRAMEFRVDFFFRVVMDAVFYATQLALFTILYRHTTTIAGWDFNQALIFVSGFFFVDALHMTIFANNMWWFPFYVNRGDLDYYLVRPVSSLLSRYWTIAAPPATAARTQCTSPRSRVSAVSVIA